MINDETKRKLRELNLNEVITVLELQQSDISSVTLPFDERIQRLVDYLYQEKYNSKIQRLMKMSKFRIPKAEVYDVYYTARGIVLFPTLFCSNILELNCTENFQLRPWDSVPNPGIYRFGSPKRKKQP